MTLLVRSAQTVASASIETKMTAQMDALRAYMDDQIRIASPTSDAMTNSATQLDTPPEDVSDFQHDRKLRHPDAKRHDRDSDRNPSDSDRSDASSN